MMKRFLGGFMAVAIAASTVAVAAPADTASAAKVPKAKYTFNMDKANKNVVAVARKGDTSNFTNTDFMPDAKYAKKIKLKYAKGKKGKALYLDRTSSYGAQLKNVKLGNKSWSVSFWVKAASSVSDFMPIFFTTSSVKEASAKWLSITKSSWLGDISPTIWSRSANEGDKAFPWYGNNEWTTDNQIAANKWVHITLTVNAKKTIEFEGESGTYKGYHGETYVNGKYWGNGAVAKSSMSNSNKFFLGINGWDTPFKGYIDNVKLWNKRLTEKQVKALFKSEK